MRTSSKSLSKKIREFYEGLAQKELHWRDMYNPGDPVMSYLQLLRFRELQKILGSDSLSKRRRTLDVGCGDGVYLRSLASKAELYVGVDISLTRVRRAKKVSAHTNLDHKCDFIVACVETLPIRDGATDFIFASEIIEHLEFPERFFVEVRRVLRAGGDVLVSSPNRCSAVEIIRGKFRLHRIVYFREFIGYLIISHRWLMNIFETLTNQHLPEPFKEHIHLFDLTELVKVFETYGFKVRSVRCLGYYIPLLSYFCTRLRLNHILEIVFPERFKWCMVIHAR